MISVVIGKKDIKNNNYIEITDKMDINHLKNVFRVKIGDKVRAVDSEKEYLGEISLIEKKVIGLIIIKINEDTYSPKVILDMGICLIKNEKMDLIIQKLTEIGINKIIPINSRRVVVKLGEKEEKKIEKWKTISKEALKQCQGIKEVFIDKITNLSEIEYSLYDLVIVPYEKKEKVYLKEIWKKVSLPPEKILVIIGPEGGFDNEEVDFLEGVGAKTISLGKRILRTETSAIVVGGIIINEFI